MTGELQAIFVRILDDVGRHQPALCRGWFRDLAPRELMGGSFAIRARNSAQLAYLTRECTPAFTTAAQRVTGRLLTVQFECDGESALAGSSNTPPDALLAQPLDPALSFDSFAVGPCNRLAHAAAVAITQGSGTTYNLLFIHGPPGSGKTHLLQAIAHASGTARAVCYLSGDQLIMQLMTALETGDQEHLRTQAERLDLLIVDDVDAFAARRQSQEALFHLLNRLSGADRQVIVAAVDPPGKIAGLHERIATRLAAGLVAPLEQPCLDTRLAIVRRQSELRCVPISEEAATVLANRFESPRALSEAIVRLDHLSRLRGSPLTIELVKESLEGSL